MAKLVPIAAAAASRRAMAEASPIQAVAANMGVSHTTVRRWVSAGCPVVYKGCRGRGKQTLLNVEAVRAWQAAPGRDADFLALASRLPELLAETALQAFKLAPDKRGAAYALAFAWQLAAQQIVEELRKINPDIPELQAIPAPIELLRKIATK